MTEEEKKMAAEASLDELAMENIERALIKLGFGLGRDSLSWQAEQNRAIGSNVLIDQLEKE